MDLNDSMDGEVKKITYLPKAGQKRKILISLKGKFEKILESKVPIAKKDYSLLVNILTRLIDDNDDIIQTESIHIITILASCLRSSMDKHKTKIIKMKVIEKY